MPDLSSRAARVHAYGGISDELFARLKLYAVGAVSGSTRGSRLTRAVSRLVGAVWLRPSVLRGLELAMAPLDWSETVVFEEIFVAGAYELDLVPFRPARVVDCGAHIGMFSLLAAARWPGIRQELYEPNPANVRRLRMHQFRNGLTWEVNEGVVAVEAGEVVLDLPRGNSHAAMIRDPSAGSASGTLRVRAWSLAERLAGRPSEPLLLKLDVEGMERQLWEPVVDVLPGDCAIFFETHHGEEGWALADVTLRSRGFAVDLKADRGRFKDGFALRTSR